MGYAECCIGIKVDSKPGMSRDLMAWGFLTLEKEMRGWTFKSAAQICQEASAIISQGGAFSIYDLPDRNGLLNSWHHDIMADVADFVRARKQWVRGTQSVPQVAILHSALHYYAANPEYLLECWSPSRQPLTGALDCLLDCHCQVDVATEDNLVRHIESYKMVVIAEQTSPSVELLSALKDYVNAGGTVLISGTNASTDYADLTGTLADGDLQDGYFYLEVDGESTTVKGPWQSVKLSGAQTLLPALKHADPFQKDFLAPAVTINRVGKGTVAGIHCRYFTYYSQTHYPRSCKLVRNLIDTLSPDFIVSVDAPPKLHIVVRQQGAATIVHLLNTGSSNPDVSDPGDGGRSRSDRECATQSHMSESPISESLPCPGL